MALIPDEIIEQVIDRSDIVETIASYIPLKQAGKNFKALCPFHNEKTPSFVVNPQKQIFHCFGCSAGGNVVSFVMMQERMEFPEAIRMLARKVNVPIPSDEGAKTQTDNIRQQIFKVNELAVSYYHNILLSDKTKAAKAARDYLKRRGVSFDTVKTFRMGFAYDRWDGLLLHLKSKGVGFGLMEKAGLVIPREKKDGYYDRFRNRIIFPIFDSRAHCRAFGARSFEPKKDDPPGAKYINSPETPVYTKGQHLYGFHLAKQNIGREDFVIITEGYVDCVIPYQAGVTNIVAALGTALTTEQIRMLRRYTKNVVMLFDMDTAGEAAMLRSLDTLIEEGMSVKVATLQEGEDPDSFVRNFGVESFHERIAAAEILFDYKLNVLSQQYDAKSIEGKAKIASELLPTIHRFRDAVKESQYLKALAQRLGVEERVLLTEYNKVGHSLYDRLQQSMQKRSDAVQETFRTVEYNILKLLLEEESFITDTKDEVLLSDFQDQKIRDVISKIFDLFEKGCEVNSKTLINSFEDQQMQQMISKLVLEDDFVAGDLKKMHRDCINWIKRNRLKLLRQDLLGQIKEAELAGDQERLDELKEKFNQSIKG